eukprot:357003-Chlamydomonas_euryale.AAC.1
MPWPSHFLLSHATSRPTVDGPATADFENAALKLTCCAMSSARETKGRPSRISTRLLQAGQRGQGASGGSDHVVIQFASSGSDHVANQFASSGSDQALGVRLRGGHGSACHGLEWTTDGRSVGACRGWRLAPTAIWGVSRTPRNAACEPKRCSKMPDPLSASLPVS